MADDSSKRSRSRGTEPPVAPTDDPHGTTTTPPLPVDDEAAVAQATTAVAVDAPPDAAEGKVKVPVDLLLRRSREWLGVEPHVMVGVLDGDEREEMTLNAARKAVEAWKAKPQNPPDDPEQED